MLHAWAKLHVETRDLRKAEINLLLFKWTSELAFIRSKFLAKCIMERAVLSSEIQDNNDGIGPDVRPPMPHQLHAFIHVHERNKREADHRQGGVQTALCRRLPLPSRCAGETSAAR